LPGVELKVRPEKLWWYEVRLQSLGWTTNDSKAAAASRQS
jgi:hypothetical protein